MNCLAHSKTTPISTLPMDNALGIKPKHNDFTKSSRLCGTCHTINLPNIDDPIKPGEKPTVLDRAEKEPGLQTFQAFARTGDLYGMAE